MQRMRIGLLFFLVATIIAGTLSLMPYKKGCTMPILDAFRAPPPSKYGPFVEGDPYAHLHGDPLKKYRSEDHPCAFPASQRVWIAGGILLIGAVTSLILRSPHKSN